MERKRERERSTPWPHQKLNKLHTTPKTKRTSMKPPQPLKPLKPYKTITKMTDLFNRSLRKHETTSQYRYSAIHAMMFTISQTSEKKPSTLSLFISLSREIPLL